LLKKITLDGKREKQAQWPSSSWVGSDAKAERGGTRDNKKKLTKITSTRGKGTGKKKKAKIASMLNHQSKLMSH